MAAIFHNTNVYLGSKISKTLLVKLCFFLGTGIFCFLISGSAFSNQQYAQPYYKNEAYLDSYRNTVIYYNSALTDRQVDKIVRAILHYSYEWNLDPRLVTAVIACESRFNPKAISPVGAVGLGQLMPQTAKEVKSNPYDITLNVRGACYILSSNLKRYHDDGSYRFTGSSKSLKLALAAYNAGPGAVSKYNGIPPYNETINYVNVVLKEYAKLCGF